MMNTASKTNISPRNKLFKEIPSIVVQVSHGFSTPEASSSSTGSFSSELPVKQEKSDNLTRFEYQAPQMIRFSTIDSLPPASWFEKIGCMPKDDDGIPVDNFPSGSSASVTTAAHDDDMLSNPDDAVDEIELSEFPKLNAVHEWNDKADSVLWDDNMDDPYKLDSSSPSVFTTVSTMFSPSHEAAMAARDLFLKKPVDNFEHAGGELEHMLSNEKKTSIRNLNGFSESSRAKLTDPKYIGAAIYQGGMRIRITMSPMTSIPSSTAVETPRTLLVPESPKIAENSSASAFLSVPMDMVPHSFDIGRPVTKRESRVRKPNFKADHAYYSPYDKNASRARTQGPKKRKVFH